MSINTIPAAAPLCPAGEPSFLLPTGAAAFWQLGASHTALGGHDVFGYSRDAKRMVVNPTADTRDVVAAAKQARPPRGVPR